MPSHISPGSIVSALSLLLLASCASPQALETALTATPSPPAMLSETPSRAPTTTHAYRGWVTATPDPAATPTTIAWETRPHRIPISKRDSIRAVPEWLSDPEAPVLLTGFGLDAEEFSLVFINGDTGETYNPHIDREISFTWIDQVHAAFGGRTLYVVSLADGTIEPIPLEDSSLEHADFHVTYINDPAPPPFTAMVPLGIPGEEDFLLVNRRLADDFSADGHFKVGLDEFHGNLDVEDLWSGDRLPLASAESGFHSVTWDHEWSPNQDYLAILQEWIEGDVADDPADRLSIYDASTQELLVGLDRQIGPSTATITSSSGEPNGLAWSPDGSRVLFLRQSEDLSVDPLPCFTNVPGGGVHCMPAIPQKHGPDVQYRLGWANSGRAIWYIACDEARGESSVCRYSLVDGEIDCTDTQSLGVAPDLLAGLWPSADDTHLLIASSTTCELEEGHPYSFGVLDASTRDYTPIETAQRIESHAPWRNFWWRP